MAKRTRTDGNRLVGDTELRKQGRAIELFHLAYCQVAAARLPLDEFAMKGGGNLRFFLRSARRSADLELDYLGRKFARFGERMDEVLMSRQLSELLRLRDIELRFEGHRAKDTETVKRWKFQLARPGMETASSKIEFSNRASTAVPVLEQMDTELARRLGGVAARIKHYLPPDAIEQKIRALAERSATEPRDVFDLDHLFRQYPEALAQSRPDSKRTLAAKDRAIDIPYDDYERLVVEYLEEDFVELYGTEQAWTDMVLRVVERLEEKQGGGR
ncbi:MAG: nucleotidyl transferase AbiEii/AbiGii toxin family protein [Chloroflexota bacterium]|nr:nucleotidyl transferase AbiEii/AbiGii toxin family protein [Chloroflexota bacterium]